LFPTTPTLRLELRIAVAADAATLFGVRQAAIRALTPTHLTPGEAAAWAGHGGMPRVERAIADDQVGVAVSEGRIVGWVQRAAAAIEGLYVAPATAGLGVGTALVMFAERLIARDGHAVFALESSRNAVGFYRRLGYVASGAGRRADTLAMRKHVDAS